MDKGQGEFKRERYFSSSRLFSLATKELPTLVKWPLNISAKSVRFVKYFSSMFMLLGAVVADLEDK